MYVIFSYSLLGRGTVCTGKIERGKVKKGDPVDILGYNKFFKCTINGKFCICISYNPIYSICI